KRGNHQARQPPAALRSFPQPGLRMDVPMHHSLLETMHTALGHARVLSNVAHTLRASLTKIVENPNTFLPKSHVGPVLQRGPELSPEFSSSKYMTDTQLSRLRPLPENPEEPPRLRDVLGADLRECRRLREAAFRQDHDWVASSIYEALLAFCYFLP